MASRRMFSVRLIDSARFLKMPISSQALYFHLGLHADDDGIVEAYTVMNQAGCSEDDLKVLVSKGFVQVLNEDLVSYITDWRENNNIRADRKIDSLYKDLLISINPDVNLLEKKARSDIKNRGGQSTDGQWTANGRTMDGIGKDSIGKDSIGEDRTDNNISPKDPKHIYGEYGHVRLTDAQKECLIEAYGEEMTLSCIQYLDEYIEMKGYKAKNHYLCIRKWVVDAVSKQKPTGNKVADQLEKSYAMMSKWAEEGS